jgi:hypothetical protein
MGDLGMILARQEQLVQGSDELRKASVAFHRFKR